MCEGCGDCGVKSNCLSLFPVETELGRKTRVHQASCNKDYSCIDGDCPSFVRVIPGEGPPKRSLPALEEIQLDVQLSRPELKAKQANIYMVGIGGTGVVTANQLLATAAVLEGKDVVGVDQTGLSQKGGPVVSQLKIVDNARQVSNCVAAGEADVFLGFDVLSSASPEHLAHGASGQNRRRDFDESHPHRPHGDPRRRGFPRARYARGAHRRPYAFSGQRLSRCSRTRRALFSGITCPRT